MKTLMLGTVLAIASPGLVCGFSGSGEMAVLSFVPRFCPGREVTADVLVFRKTTPPSGGVKPTVITMQPGRGEYLGISFFESQLDSAGEQWRSSAWTAIASSSFILGEDLSQHSFSFDAEGNIDGPSAGGLFTSSTMALLLGHFLQRDVTMTGTINPDGSIGPVGGIPLKVQAAHDQGKRRVVIPAGQLTPELQSLETKLGIDVQEATHLGEAYQLLTGHPLPRPVGYEDVPPQMSAAGAAAWQTLIEDLHQQYQTTADDLRQTAIPEDFQFIQQESRRRFSQSRQALEGGDLAQAYSMAREALIRLWLVQNLIQAQAGMAEFQDKPWDVSTLTQVWDPIIQDAEALLKDLEAVEVKTANQAISTSRAYGQLILAIGLKNLSMAEIDQLKTSQAVKEPGSEAYRRAVFYLAIAPTLATDQVQTAREVLSQEAIGGQKPLQEQELAGFTNTLHTAAVASLKAFESLTIQPLADAGAASFEQVSADFKSKDISYFLAVAALSSLDDLTATLENQQNAVYARLGASQIAYLISSTLISKYYSLKASYDPDLETYGIRSPVEFENQRGLINMLDLAEHNARGNIAMAEWAGNDLTQQILMYEQARLWREGDPADKVHALQMYWNASLEARLMTIFSGEFLLVPQPGGAKLWIPVLFGLFLVVGVALTWRYQRQLTSQLNKP